jgi:hypothetical protein
LKENLLMNENQDQNTESTSEEAIGSGNDARLALLSSIADQTDAGRAEELANVNDDGSTEPFAAPAREQEQEQQAAEEVAEESPASEEKRYRIKVNGRELELTESELIARAQKIEAADDYLRQAAEAKRRVATSPQPENSPVLNQAEDDLSLIRAIKSGSEEEAAVALQRLRQQARLPQPPQDDVSRIVDERLEFNKAIEKFRTEYSDIENDPYLRKLALDRDAELLQSGDRRPYWERYDEIGKSLRSWRDTLVSKEQISVKEKEARKAAAPKVPSTASAKTKPPVQADDEDESPSAVIASMSKVRGGPQWMRN